MQIIILKRDIFCAVANSIWALVYILYVSIGLGDLTDNFIQINDNSIDRTDSLGQRGLSGLILDSVTTEQNGDISVWVTHDYD